MPRVTGQQLRLSPFATRVGLCQADAPRIFELANECIQRLLMEGGETGWWGCWAKVAFLVQRSNPFITLPPGYARAINMDVCRQPIRVQNEFMEFLEYGIGLREAPPQIRGNFCGVLQGFERGNYPTLIDLPTTSYLRLYPTDPADYNRRVLIGGAKDQNGNGIYTQDGLQSVNGFYLTLQAPFDTSAMLVSSFQNIAKDFTQGDVILKAVDPVTGVETTLSRYGPDEISPSYRRYYINSLPSNCCSQIPITPGLVQVTAMLKYEYQPIRRDTDFLIIGNVPALIEEAQAIRYSSIDEPAAAQLEAKHHSAAIRLLQAEMRHELGSLEPAVNFAPFGSARLCRAGIGSLT